VRDIREVRVVSSSGDSADRLVAELTGVVAARVDDPDVAIAGADVIVAATNSSTPVFDGSRVEPGTHVTGVGSYTPEMREVDAALVTRARVIVDQREAVMEEAGDLIGPIREGIVSEDVMVGEIGDVVLGRVEGRTSRDEITFFKSVGNAVQDVAVAARVLSVADADGRGLVVEM
jgi:ornithine cyclodeaminase/alanine dehydrogenase-like protein (mu-crystallin family)